MLVCEERTGAAHPGLHLVEDQQRAVAGGDIARRREIAVGRHDDAALPHDRLQEHRSGLVADRGRQRVGVAVGHVGDVAGQRRERRLLGRLTGQRQAPIVRPWKPPCAATSFVRPVSRDSLKAASLASVPELQNNTRVSVSAPSRPTSASASAIPGSVAYRFEVCPSVTSVG